MVRTATVEGLTPDGRTLLLRLDGELVELSLAEVKKAQRDAPSLPLGGGPSPREIQARIRSGESADDIARACGMPVEDVARYEGPVLAERAHHLRAAQAADADGRTIGARVAEHAERFGEGPVVWDCFQTDPRRWEVTASAGALVVRLAWDPGTRRADPVDDTARQALGHAPLPEEALESVLRQVRTPRARKAPAADGPVAPRKRAQVPLWDDISAEVSGRASPAEG